MIGIVSGRCFAGNAALLGCCDVIIAAKNANIGMGGPVMIEGGGLGVFAPEEVGPVDVQTKSGVIDILVEDDVEAVAAAKKYLSYFQGKTDNWEAAPGKTESGRSKTGIKDEQTCYDRLIRQVCSLIIENPGRANSIIHLIEKRQVSVMPGCELCCFDQPEPCEPLVCKIFKQVKGNQPGESNIKRKGGSGGLTLIGR
jgi:hypothetical protein